MPDKTYKLVEIVGVSEESVQQAVRNALAKASKTLRNIDWFEVVAIRGWVKNNRDPVFQVQVKVGFRLLDRDVLHGSTEEPSLSTPVGKAKAKSRPDKSKKRKK
jgi:hypothetical protein